jgi:hypothetical protein
MRPLAGSEAFQPRSRKSSLVEPPLPVTDTRSTSPVTFFLRRGSQSNDPGSSADVTRHQNASPVQSLADTLDSLPRSTSTLVPKNAQDETSESPRRRSTLNAKEPLTSHQSPSIATTGQAIDPEPLTPLLIPSDTSSLPSSPKSTSTRSLRPSDIDSAIEDTGSQAVLSSGDEEQEPLPPSGETAPQLIMPSIKMPSRRPFTQHGKQIGSFKILVAGSKGIVLSPATFMCSAHCCRFWQNFFDKVNSANV